MSREKDHKETRELLPWYVNDTLEGSDMDLVLRHLADCKDCQEERDRLYELQTLVREESFDAPGYELSLKRTIKRIEESERNKESTREVEFKPSMRRLVPVGIAASVLSLLVAGAAWINVDRSIPAEYETLSTDQLSSGAPHQMELGFHNPIPAMTMRKALIETNSNIISGPDENGNYLVEVVVPNTMTDIEYLARIREIDGVVHARYTHE